jgi:hypothetical protein
MYPEDGSGMLLQYNKPIDLTIRHCNPEDHKHLLSHILPLPFLIQTI